MNTTTNFLSAHQPLQVTAPTMSSTCSTTAKRRFLRRPEITPREKEVLYLIAYEYSAKEIAAKLFISYETVSSHRKNIMMKLDVKNTAGMVRVAYQENILPT